MKAIVLVATLLAAPGLALAANGGGPPDDSAAHVADLREFGGPMIYLYCSHGTKVSNCKNPTFFEETNGLEKLQRLGLETLKKRYEPDQRMLL